jgi:site-specific DNA-methyltransferase (adenine-specific)
MDLRNGDCLELMKTIPDKSVDLFLCDLPYGETDCSWDTKIDIDEFWKEFKRIRKSPRVACIHFCSTKFGHTLIKSWGKGFKMDMVFKKPYKLGGLSSKYRPLRNHEMVYFFYDQAPKYNRDKYHKRIKTFSVKKENGKDAFGHDNIGVTIKESGFASNFEPPNPASVIESVLEEEEEEKEQILYKDEIYGKACGGKGLGSKDFKDKLKEDGFKMGYTPTQPASIFESEYVAVGKRNRNHQTEKPQDILEFFLKYWTDEDDVVLDPTMGSGSTGVACKKLNRKFIGFELDEKIFNVAKKRCIK